MFIFGGFLLLKLSKFSRVITIIVFLIPFQILADENGSANKNDEKLWNIFGGLGDKIFSIFGSTIQNKDNEKKFMLNELSKSNGELTIGEIKELEKHQLEMMVKENEESLKLLNKILDPETGMMSGFIKLGNKVYEKDLLKRDDQKKKLDMRIDEIISQYNSESLQVIKLKLSSIRWSPINHL